MINAIIPARAGSKRIKSKNTVLLGDHPLIAYTIAACRLSKRIDRIIVSTECENIAKIAKKYGAEVPFIRPDHLSLDTSTDQGFLKHFFDNIDADKVLLMRPTSPLRNPETIDNVTDQYMKMFWRGCYTGYRSMTESNHSPYKMFQIVDETCKGFFENFKGEKDYTNLPNQSFPKSYVPNGYCDMVLQKTVREGKTTFGNKIFGATTENIVDVDNYFDLDLVRNQIETKYDFLSVHLNKLK